MRKPFSLQLDESNLVKKQTQIQRPKNSANTSAFRLLHAKNTAKHTYMRSGHRNSLSFGGGKREGLKLLPCCCSAQGSLTVVLGVVRIQRLEFSKTEVSGS